MTRAPEAPGRAAPYVIVGLFLLSIPTIAYAILIHAFGCGDACTSTNLEGEIELILAYVNLAWVGLAALGFGLGRKRVVDFSFCAFAVNYVFWIVMAAATSG